MFYTSPAGRPVHSNTNSISLGNIQPSCSYCTKTIHSDIPPKNSITEWSRPGQHEVNETVMGRLILYDSTTDVDHKIVTGAQGNWDSWADGDMR